MSTYLNELINLEKNKTNLSKDEKFTFSLKETLCSLKSLEQCIQLLIVLMQ